jgi:AraC family transcriptional regulator
MAKIIGTNVDTLNRLFPVLNNISLAEYIRKRRLTKAGIDLLNGEKVINVSTKYMYNSPVSFSVAFENMHGIKPSNLKNINELKNYPPIIFSQNFLSTIPEYRFSEENEFVLYGFKKKMKLDETKNIAPIFWKEKKHEFNRINIAQKYYGIIEYNTNWKTDGVYYWVALDSQIDGAEKIIIPKSKWIIFVIKDFDSDFIPTISSNATSKYPEFERYEVKETVSLEVYYKDKKYIEIWIQIN